MAKLQQLKQWFYSLSTKDQRMVSLAFALIVLTLFYLIVWEPVHQGLEDEQQKQQAQQEILLWMQQAASEVSSLRSAGGTSVVRDRNKPITLVIEQAVNNAGLKTAVTKIESSGKDGARVTLKEAPFNQVLVWLNTLSTFNGVQVVSANIERSDTPGRADARLTFERP